MNKEKILEKYNNYSGLQLNEVKKNLESKIGCNTTNKNELQQHLNIVQGLIDLKSKYRVKDDNWEALINRYPIDFLISFTNKTFWDSFKIRLKNNLVHAFQKDNRFNIHIKDIKFDDKNFKIAIKLTHKLTGKKVFFETCKPIIKGWNNAKIRECNTVDKRELFEFEFNNFIDLDKNVEKMLMRVYS